MPSTDTQFKKGRPPHNKGKKGVSEKTRELMRLSKIKAGIIPPSKKGVKDTIITRLRKKLSARRGEKNNKWKGGITPINRQVRTCTEYRQWRSDIFTRDGFACVWCEAKSGNRKAVYLEADHYPKMFSEIMQEYNIKSLEEALNCEEFWNINNGRTLCKDCHNTTKNGKTRPRRS